MSDDATPIVAAGTGEFGHETLSTDGIDAVLADFRAWLLEAKDAAARTPEDRAEFDVASVLQHFVALRQEVNLQTKASRNQLEQNAQTIAMLQESLGVLQHQEAMLEQNDADVQDEVVRPLLKTLIDAHDALCLAERQVSKLLGGPMPGAPETESNAAPIIQLKMPYWARWLGLDRSIERQLAPLYTWRQTHPPMLDNDRYRQGLEALLTGYRMSMQRIERAFEQYGLEPFDCVGEAFDPETMEVADVVREEGRTQTEVIEEVRRGYVWHGKLFRCAQVRVARGCS